ncbi:DUF5316 domain-containing protein [Fictibacillus fluitans]|uniref:DUF5316 domain-containing protein n=1 Tax=Fictibacillus fluitans TaxID=3058422 RepID=A0ABT8HYK4_9BACL|nr:DUF5316 domain-containing protein [Fictibacillus sp. NE201]MDN4525849.1 DUF5316 domain-containing protein [Fictibacillus sp. NE201]
MIITSLLLNDWSLLLNVCGAIGLLSLLAAGLFTGAFVNGDQLRANFNTETKEHRKERLISSKGFLMFGLPNLLIAIIYFAGSTYF